VADNTVGVARRSTRTLGDMDTPAKRRIAERVRRALTEKLHASGLVRGKTTFWARPREHVIEFVHLHLFTFAPSFRAHCGIRVLNDEFRAAALNGPDSDSCRSGGRRAYALDFTDEAASVTLCADEISRFCIEVAEPWFEHWRGPQKLLGFESPLDERARLSLERAFNGSVNAEAVRFSKELLGVA